MSRSIISTPRVIREGDMSKLEPQMNSQGKTFADGVKPKSARAPCQSRKCTWGNNGWFLRIKYSVRRLMLQRWV